MESQVSERNMQHTQCVLIMTSLQKLKTGGNFFFNELHDCMYVGYLKIHFRMWVSEQSISFKAICALHPAARCTNWATHLSVGAIEGDRRTMRSTSSWKREKELLRRKFRNRIAWIGHFSSIEVNGPVYVRRISSSLFSLRPPGGIPRGGQSHKDVCADKNI